MIYTNSPSGPYGPTYNAILGATVVSARAGDTPDVTPVATQVYKNWDYTYNVQAYQVHMQILDKNTNDLTLQTNTAIVGQSINLTCQVVFTNSFYGKAFTVTNFQWTVPGITFSDYVATASSAVLYTNFPTTNQNVAFYWVDGASNRVVQCTANVDGATITGQAAFNVIRPEATWTLTPKSTVAVDTNYRTNPEYPGYYWLHLGDTTDVSTNKAGMYFAFQVNDLHGYTNGYTISFYQVGTINWKENIESGGLTGSAFVAGRGYDSVFPVPWISVGSPNVSGYSADWPASVLTGEIAFYWRQDNFEDYLMFTPAGGRAVPLQLATWNWYGRAQRVGTNSPPPFVGVTPFTNPQAAVGSNYFNHPTWTNNLDVIKTNWQYNATEYPTP